MAFRLKQWVGVVALSFASVAAWRLPLDYLPASGAHPRSAAELRYDSLARELRQARAVLAQVRRGTEMPRRALSTATDRVSVIVPDGAGVDTDDAAALQARVRELVRALGTRDPSVVVGHAYAADGGGAAGFSIREVERYEVFAGLENGTPYCVNVRVTRSGSLDQMVYRDANIAPAGTLLGPCIQYAKHGLPGVHVREWLERGGVGMARGERLGPRPPVPPVWQIAYLRRLGSPLSASDGALYFVRGDSMQPERCLTGRADVCATLFLHPELVDLIGESDRLAAMRSPALWAGRPHTWPFPADNEYLLSDLEQEFGAEAFHRFWTSDEDVRPAFESAFGVDLGEWLLDWLDAGPGIEPATPAPTLSAAFGSLLLVGLMTGLATFWQKRRQVA